MVSEQEMKRFDDIERVEEKTSYNVCDLDMKQFDTAWELQEKIGDRKEQFQKERGLKAYPAYDKLEEECQISVTSIKQTISGRMKVTRKFLYKFAVGLHMSVDEANEYFALCGGELNLKNKEDFICYRALVDGDTIFEFIDQFEKYTDLKISLGQKKRS